MSDPDYWQETVEISYKEHTGKDLPSDVAEAMGGDLAVSAENESMAYGHDEIPNPKDSEMRNLEKRHKTEIEEMEKQHRRQIEEDEDYQRRLKRELREAREKLEESNAAKGE